MKKKDIIIIFAFAILLLVVVFVLIKNNKNSYNSELEGRWTSVEGTLIKVIKEYKDNQPVYFNDNIVEYWLDIKKDGKYILYFSDVIDKSRSNYSIENNIVERGKYNINPNDENIIYFNSDDKNHVDNSSIWSCKISENNKLFNCTNYADEFVKNN